MTFDEHEEFLRELYLRGMKEFTDAQIIDIGRRARATLKRRVPGSIINSRAKLWACEQEWLRRHPPGQNRQSQ